MIQKRCRQRDPPTCVVISSTANNNNTSKNNGEVKVTTSTSTTTTTTQKNGPEIMLMLAHDSDDIYYYYRYFCYYSRLLVLFLLRPIFCLPLFAHSSSSSSTSGSSNNLLKNNIISQLGKAVAILLLSNIQPVVATDSEQNSDGNEPKMQWSASTLTAATVVGAAIIYLVYCRRADRNVEAEEKREQPSVTAAALPVEAPPTPANSSITQSLSTSRSSSAVDDVAQEPSTPEVKVVTAELVHAYSPSNDSAITGSGGAAVDKELDGFLVIDPPGYSSTPLNMSPARPPAITSNCTLSPPPSPEPDVEPAITATTAKRQSNIFANLHHMMESATATDLEGFAFDTESINTYDEQQRTPLHLAIEWNNVDAVRFLLNNDASTSLTDAEGLNALHLASRFNRPAIVDLLLKKNVPVMPVVAATQWTSLHFAACVGADAIVGSLLKAGANPNKCDIWLETPLHKAAGEGHAQAAKRLFEAGADVTICNFRSQTPIEVAFTSAYDDLAAMLSSTEV